jgi:hypothetical protein
MEEEYQSLDASSDQTGACEVRAIHFPSIDTLATALP